MYEEVGCYPEKVPLKEHTAWCNTMAGARLDACTAKSELRTHLHDGVQKRVEELVGGFRVVRRVPFCTRRLRLTPLLHSHIPRPIPHHQVDPTCLAFKQATHLIKSTQSAGIG